MNRIVDVEMMLAGPPGEGVTASEWSEITGAVQRGLPGRRFDVREFGAVEGTDATAAFQAAADAVVAAPDGGTLVFEGEYDLSAPITFTKTDLYGIGIQGGGRGSLLTQTADNAPFFVLDSGNAHSITIGGFRATWSTGPNAAKTNRLLVQCTGTASPLSFYNSSIHDITTSNGHYVLGAETTLVWGVAFENIAVTAYSGGFSRMWGNAGQPNNRFSSIYIGAQQMTGPIFVGRAVNAEMEAIEINQAHLGPVLIQDYAGGNYVIGLFICEVGTWGSARSRLFYLDDSTMVARHIGLIGTATQPTTVFRTTGRGYIDVDLLINGMTASGSGALYIAETGSANQQNPNASRGEVEIGRVRTYSDLVSWSTGANPVALTDATRTGSADAVRVREWNDPGRVNFLADASVTLPPGGARLNIATTLTANRTITLPDGNLMHSGRAFEFVKTEAGAGSLTVAPSVGAGFATIPAASKGRVAVVWQRSLVNGPAAGWVVVDSATWT